MPVPTIFLIDNSNQITEMKGQPYDSEERLQNFLAEFPSVLASGQVSAGAPPRWLLVKREAGVPSDDGGGERWSVDHLFIDQNGIPTLVEVKRSTDTRIRREVVGQLLDYAANAVQYWPIETIRQWFEESCGEGLDPNAHLADIIGLADSTDEAVARFWETVETNLRAGRLRLIFAADEIPPELRRIIEFLDEQMMPAEVLGIEIRQYVGANGHTLVPSVIRSLRRSAPPINTRSAGQWDRGSLLSALLRRTGADILAVAKTTIEWAEKNGLLFSWGRGRFDGSCFLGIMHEGVAYYPVSIWTSGMIQMQFQTLRQRGVTPEMIEKLAAGLRIIPGVEMPPESLNRFPSFKMALLRKPQALEQFLKTVESFLEQVRTETKANPAAATE